VVARVVLKLWISFCICVRTVYVVSGVLKMTMWCRVLSALTAGVYSVYGWCILFVCLVYSVNVAGATSVH